MADVDDYEVLRRDYATLSPAQKAEFRQLAMLLAREARMRAIAAFFRRLAIWRSPESKVRPVQPKVSRMTAIFWRRRPSADGPGLPRG